MKVTLISHTQEADKLLVYTKSTRLTQGEETRSKIDKMDNAELLHELEYMASTIPSSWEFIDYVFEIQDVTRAFTHQFVRTRTGSYAQQTMRMLEKKGFTHLTPDTVKENATAYNIYEDCMDTIQRAYDDMLDLGIPAEDARGVLPTNIHTNIIAKFNLRTIAEMAKSRTGGRTQSEYRDVFDAMSKAVIDVHPWAELFLFPDRWGKLDRLEEILKYADSVARLNAKNEVIEGMKIIDKFKKEVK